MFQSLTNYVKHLEMHNELLLEEMSNECMSVLISALRTWRNDHQVHQKCTCLVMYATNGYLL